MHGKLSNDPSTYNFSTHNAISELMGMDVHAEASRWSIFSLNVFADLSQQHPRLALLVEPAALLALVLRASNRQSRPGLWEK